ncbi:tail fiber domain-containing protein [Thalassomonas sp. RHCl1]|uniref:tail fiber domain-containing protein n=1 Tax=Thalassomonas sp. RHCl1 TaxID=2995320 RepID=UPI00248BCF5C|nr:tail fiber domain-containing protein [Thalassomonas sp. RHCl1]
MIFLNGKKDMTKTLAISLILLLSNNLQKVRAENVTYGTNAGASLSTGDENVLLGDSAGAAMTSTDKSVALGAGAGQAIENRDYLVIAGYQAGSQDTYFYNSVFMGTRAGFSFSSGYAALLGYEAGYGLSDSGRQAIAGSGAGFSGGDSSDDNAYLGYQAAYNLAGEDNIAVGSGALYGNTTGVAPAASVALGYRAAYGIGKNAGNVAIGEGAGYNLGNGGYNTLIGARAGENVQDNNNETYDYKASTMVGSLAGLETQNGAEANSFLGVAAGSANQTGDYNVVIGAFADFADWSSYSDSQKETIFTSDFGTPTGLTALDTDARWGTLVGAYGMLSGDVATAIGYSASATAERALALGSGASASHSQSIAIGYGASSHGDYIAVLGNTSTTAWHPHADGVTALGNSSYRFSNLYSQAVNVVADSDSSALVTIAADAAADAGDSWQLSAADNGDFSLSNDISGSQSTLFSLNNGGDLTVTGDVNVLSDANFKKDISPIDNALILVNQLYPVSYYWRPQAFRDDRQHLGLIAQEVEMLLPEVVKTNTDGYKSVNYAALLPLLAQAGGELNNKQDVQQHQLDSLEARLDAIEAALVSKRN